ncbi:MAG: hypothetical protein ACLP0B_13420 [Steroidobacteraceae bacterium]
MANWVLKGLRIGVKSSAYPGRPDDAPGVSPGRPMGTRLKSPTAADELVARCPTQAIGRENSGIAIDQGRCVHCSRCRRDVEEAAAWQPGYEWAAQTSGAAAALRKLAGMFGRSLHVRFVDAGACGACMSEARQINNPYYNMHRLGFFITPTPRSADILLIAGPVSDAAAAAQDLRRNADTEARCCHRRLCCVRRRFRPELRGLGRRRRDHPG